MIARAAFGTQAAVFVLTAAGVTLTAVPAAADAPDPARWSVSNHATATSSTATTRPWTVTDHAAGAGPARRVQAASARPSAASAPSRARHRIAGHHRPQRAHRAPREAWTASSTCRPTTGQGSGEATWYVGPGDTLWLIAACHPGIDVDQLRARNGLRGDRIHVGQVLHIPARDVR